MKMYMPLKGAQCSLIARPSNCSDFEYAKTKGGGAWAILSPE